MKEHDKVRTHLELVKINPVNSITMYAEFLSISFRRAVKGSVLTLSLRFGKGLIPTFQHHLKDQKCTGCSVVHPVQYL